eukprot:GHVS01076765.1.p1 GENE.GHVS01076765.1~~GHVS01076765.1.p1  ORF type:complete len:404 (-),score=49.07 GHVS01076765.1:257-1468(-)
MEFQTTSPMQYAFIASVPFERKKQWLYAQLNSFRVNYASAWVVVDVHRDEFLVSSFNELRALGIHDFHKEFKFRFAGEPAQDAGGLSREWFTLISKHLFDPINGLFSFSDVDNLTYQINSHSCVNDNHLEYFHFAGQVMGKAIFDKQFILCPLTTPLLKQLLKRKVAMEDLALVDQAMFNSLEWMRDNSIDGIFFETFAFTEDRFGEPQIIDLKLNGQEIEVTDANKEEYIQLRMQHKIRLSIREQLNALTEGFWSVIPLPLIRVFDFQELDLLLNGLPVLDVDDWKRNTMYKGEYAEDHVVVQWFWEVVSSELSQEDRARLLQFTTGTSRVPAEGFKGLESNRGQKAAFTLQSVERTNCPPLLRAHTCFNRLDLPIYESREELSSLLTRSLEMDVTGFGLAE